MRPRTTTIVLSLGLAAVIAAWLRAPLERAFPGLRDWLGGQTRSDRFGGRGDGAGPGDADGASSAISASDGSPVTPGVGPVDPRSSRGKDPRSIALLPTIPGFRPPRPFAPGAGRPPGSSGDGSTDPAPPAPTASAEPAPAPRPPGIGLLGTYYKLVDKPVRDFPGVAGLSPTLERVDPRIDFPHVGSFNLPFLARNLIVRWHGFIAADDDGVYTFSLGSDDGAKLSIDGSLVVDDGGLHPPLVKSGDAYLSHGLHAIEILFFQNEGDAQAILSWIPPRGPPDIVPPDVLYPAGPTPGGDAPSIDAVKPLGARRGDTITITGRNLPAPGEPLRVTFDGVPAQAEVGPDGTIMAPLPAGVDQGDFIVYKGDTASPGFPYAAGDVFGLLAEYEQAPGAMKTLADMPPAGAVSAFRRVDGPIEFRSAGAFSLPFAARRFATRLRGQLYVQTAGPCAFRLDCDDGGRLTIDGSVVATLDGIHGAKPADGAIPLGAGFHDVLIEHFQNDGGAALLFEWAPPGGSVPTLVPRRVLYAPAEVAPIARPQVLSIDPAQARVGDLIDVLGQDFTGDPARDVVIFTDGVTVRPEHASATRLSVRVPKAAMTGPVTAQAGPTVADGQAALTILGRGLRGAYYRFDGPLERLPSVGGRAPDLARIDARILFGENYSFGLPFDPHHFAALWTGSLVAPADGAYQFSLGSDDGSRLSIDDQVVIDSDGIHGYANVTGGTNLASGLHRVRVEFFENEGVGAVRFGWKPPGRGWDIVPASALSPD